MLGGYLITLSSVEAQRRYMLRDLGNGGVPEVQDV